MTLHGESGTITVNLTVEPAYPRAGELVQFRLSATDSEGGLFAIGFVPGDSRMVTTPGPPMVDCVARDPIAPPREPKASHHTDEFTHTYRVAAERHFRAVVATGDCGRRAHRAELAGTITVLPGGTVPSNGPRLPEGGVHQNKEGAPPNGAWMSIGAADADGLIHRVVVDWGDGSEPSVLEVPRGEYACVDEPTAYPHSGDSYGMEHLYPGPGVYTVTVTVESVGCDGKHPQVARASGIATIEAPTSD